IEGRTVEVKQQLVDLVKQHPAEPRISEALVLLGELQSKSGELTAARKTFLSIVEKHPTRPEASLALDQLGRVNLALLTSSKPQPTDLLHEVIPGDTLGALAKRYGVTADVIRAANGISGDLIRVGQKLRVPNVKFKIAVSRAQNTLVLFDNDEPFKQYRVATGLDQSTPVGSFNIVNKLENPIWYTAGAVVPPESPANILGTRWLGISAEGYGIHGTTEPESIGTSVTAGCVRMRNQEVEELYALVPVGTEVIIQD
ncbi:MAG: L,D-transpeptidase family protein, partial [Candidatus Omnitrophica bacterium]|nr:L,D-transpeptidase family protein [Candidatus Omnitrophota bacterium]